MLGYNIIATSEQILNNMYIKSRFWTVPVIIGLASNLVIPQLSSPLKNVLASPYEAWADASVLGLADRGINMPDDSLTTVYGHALVQQANHYTPVVVANNWVVITAYSSTPDQTDSTPFITASGTHVRDGIIACNFLRFGTKVKIPALFGDKIFVVEDRMALKNSHKIDIWFETREQAKQFGLKVAEVEVLKYN